MVHLCAGGYFGYFNGLAKFAFYLLPAKLTAFTISQIDVGVTN